MIHGPYRDSPEVQQEPPYPAVVVEDLSTDVTDVQYRVVQTDADTFVLERRKVVWDALMRASSFWETIFKVSSPAVLKRRAEADRRFGYYDAIREAEGVSISPRLLWWLISELVRLK